AQGDVEVRVGGGESGKRLRVIVPGAGSAEEEGLADQRDDILAPQGNVTRSGVGVLGCAVAVCAAVRSMAGCATTTVVEVSTEDVGVRCPSGLRHCKGRRGEDHEGN